MRGSLQVKSKCPEAPYTNTTITRICRDMRRFRLGRAIESDHGPKKPSALAEGVTALRRHTSPHLAQMLEDC